MKTLAITVNTFKETSRQPVFFVLLVIGSVLIVLTAKIPLFLERREEMRMVADMGLATMALAGLLIGLLSSSSAVADEIEKKTALTVLSKPVRRAQFIFGKYFGIMLTVLLAVIVISVILGAVIFSMISEVEQEAILFGEHSLDAARLAQREMRIGYASAISQGALLTYLQLGVLVAVSVAISTHLPMVVNLVGCFFLFAVGHMSPWLYDFLQRRGEIARAVAQVLYTLVPNLENFNVLSTLAKGQAVTGYYILVALVYGLGYALVGLLVAVLLIERRELA